jgi:hypothetical protein
VIFGVHSYAGVDLENWLPKISDYADIASLLGLVVSILGFGFTLRQVKKSRTAAEEAVAIARRAIDDVGSRLLFTQVGTAVRLLQELRGSCRDNKWDRAIDRCEQLRIVLAGLVDDCRLQERERRNIAFAIDDMALVIKHLEGIEEAKGSLPRGTRRKLDKIMIDLGGIDGRLKIPTLEA